MPDAGSVRHAFDEVIHDCQEVTRCNHSVAASRHSLKWGRQRFRSRYREVFVRNTGARSTMSHDNDAGAAHSSPPLSGRSRGWAKGTLRLFGPSLVVGFIAPFIFPGLRRAARPVAKGIVKGALNLGESAKEAAVAAKEELTDLMAEVHAEREQEARQASEKSDTR
jgi:hypothetical protein